MSIQRQPVNDGHGEEPVQADDWVRIPAVVDVNGDRVVTLRDERGLIQTRLVAELVLEAFVGPQPRGGSGSGRGHLPQLPEQGEPRMGRGPGRAR